MREFLGLIIVSFCGACWGVEPDISRVQGQLKSENYSVSWEKPRAILPTATLEIGDGSGHGFSLGWVRFRPGRDGVDVLTVKLNGNRQPYKSKWPPDLAPVVVAKAGMKKEAYATLLADLAIVDAAKLKAIERDSIKTSSSDFWVNARLATDKETLLDLNWAGYRNSRDEMEFAKPQAAVSIAREAIKDLSFQEQLLEKEDRAWASSKFSRDWKKMKDLDFHWWVRERYIITIGVIGDSTALPTLREILEGDAKDRTAYYAINAITRLTKNDLRGNSVEEMNIEHVKGKILSSRQEKK